MSNNNYFKLVEEAFNELKSNNISDAKQIFDKALNIMPEGTLAIYGKALCFYVEGQFKISRNLCEKALKIDRTSIPEDFYEDLLSKTDSKCNNDENELDELLQNGLELIYRGYYTQSNSFFDSILKSYPENPDATVGKAYSLYQFGNFQRANALCRTIYNGYLSKEYKVLYDEIMGGETPNNAEYGSPNSVNSLLDDALNYINRGLYESAETKFDEVLQLDSTNIDAMVGIAYCLYKSGYFSQSQQLCSTITPSNISFNFLSLYDEIMSYHERTRNQSSGSDQVNSLLNSALNLVNQGDYNTARNIFKKASKLDSKDPNAIVGQAYCFYKINRESYSRTLCKKIDKFALDYRFLRFYDEIMKNNTSRNRSNNNASWKNEQYNSSQNSYNGSNNLSTSELCRRGKTYLKNNNFKDAKKCFNKALKINPNDVDALMGNAKCFYHFGYDSLAFEECEKALKIDKSIAYDSFYLEVKKIVDNL